MTPHDAAAALAYAHDARQAFALIAGLGIVLVIGVMSLPVGVCRHCPHCERERQQRAAEQERLRREYEQRTGLGPIPDGPPRQPGERAGDVPGVVVPSGAADQAARPVGVEAQDPPGDAPSS